MHCEKKFKLPRIGMRVIKTIISVSIIVFTYSLIDRNPCFACIGAVFGMGSALDEGKRAGGNRFIGTLVGGVIALCFYPLYHFEPLGIPGWIYLTLGLFCVLYISQLLGVHGSIQPGSVVYYVVIFTVPQTNFVIYTINRIIDTGIGVALSLVLSHLFPSQKDRERQEELAC